MQGSGGIDSYANAISDIYQDNFDEGIFTGKGIYNLKVFNKILQNEIPENTVLSHDLLEGNYLRCGLATDILVLDEYPSKYNAYISRLERWIRGDWQIIGWLFKKITIKNGEKRKNPLNKLSKFKIIDNLRRSLLSIQVLSLITNYWILLLLFKVDLFQIILLAIISFSFPAILDLLNSIIFKKGISKDYILAHKNIVPTIGNLKGSFLRAIFNLSFLPYIAATSFNAIIKTLYRLIVTKKHLLEWETAEESEKKSKTNFNSYCKTMCMNLIFGIISITLGILMKNIISVILGALWIVGPYIAYKISQEIKNKEEISKESKEYLIQIGEKTWQFFKDNMNEKNNFLPPDNYQEDRKEKIAR